MTNIASVNNMSFKGQSYTEKGNTYDKCHAGKVIVGAGLGTMGVYAAHSTINTAVKTMQKNPIFSEILNHYKNPSFRRTTFFTTGMVYGLVGLGIGALIDHAINKGRRADADGKAAALNKHA